MRSRGGAGRCDQVLYFRSAERRRWLGQFIGEVRSTAEHPIQVNSQQPLRVTRISRF